MEDHNSDLLPIEKQPRIQVPKPWRRNVETCTILMCLIGGGFGLGYVYGTRIADKAHSEEISRLQQAWGGRLASITGKVESAVDKASTAVQAAGEAVQAAKEK